MDTFTESCTEPCSLTHFAPVLLQKSQITSEDFLGSMASSNVTMCYAYEMNETAYLSVF